MRAAISLLTLVLAGCSAASPSGAPPTREPTPATASSPIATPYVPPTLRPLTVAPYVPGPAWLPFGDPIVVDPSITSVTNAAHGIRIRISADLATFSAADGLWVTTVLENRGRKALYWITDGCAIHVGVSARTDVDWTYGAEQRGTFKVYKDWVLDRHSNYEPYPIDLWTVPDWAVDKGPFGCADMGMGHELEPGGHLEARHFVRALTGRDGNYGIPPSGPVLLTGSFSTWYREGEDFDSVHHESVVVSLAVTLEEGRDPALISPGQAVDVALGSPQIQDLLLEWSRVPEFNPTSLAYDAENEQWRVGITEAGNTSGERRMVILVDAREARVVEITDLPDPTPIPAEPPPG